jgi:hypothetical protein
MYIFRLEDGHEGVQEIGQICRIELRQEKLVRYVVIAMTFDCWLDSTQRFKDYILV